MVGGNLILFVLAATASSARAKRQQIVDDDMKFKTQKEKMKEVFQDRLKDMASGITKNDGSSHGEDESSDESFDAESSSDAVPLSDAEPSSLSETGFHGNFGNEQLARPLEDELLKAIKQDNDQLVQILVDTPLGPEAMVPLCYAAGYGKTHVVKQLLKMKASALDCKNKAGHTPIHLAAVKNNLPVLQDLINAKADLEARMPPIDCTPLGSACYTKAGHVRMVQELITQKANIEAQDSNQNRPLHRAAMRGHAQICELLISQKADLEAKNKKGKTPLKLAKKDAKKYLESLLKK